MTSPAVALLFLATVLATAQGQADNGTEVQGHQQTLLFWPAVSSLVKSSWAMVEGRAKKGDKGGGHAALMMMGSMFLMLALTALAALSGKALAAAMAALLLAAMSLLKKGHHGGSHSYEVVSVPHTHHHRSLPEHEPYATSYAYESSPETVQAATSQVLDNHHMSTR